MNTTTDHFATDRATLERALAVLHDHEPVVTLGEWVADNMLGDPLLTPSMAYALHAVEMLRAADTFIALAIDRLPKPTDDTVRRRYEVHYGQNDGSGYVVTDSLAPTSDDWRGLIVFRSNNKSDAAAKADELNATQS